MKIAFDLLSNGKQFFMCAGRTSRFVWSTRREPLELSVVDALLIAERHKLIIVDFTPVCLHVIDIQRFNKLQKEEIGVSLVILHISSGGDVIDQPDGAVGPGESLALYGNAHAVAPVEKSNVAGLPARRNVLAQLDRIAQDMSESGTCWANDEADVLAAAGLIVTQEAEINDLRTELEFLRKAPSIDTVRVKNAKAHMTWARVQREGGHHYFAKMNEEIAFNILGNALDEVGA